MLQVCRELGAYGSPLVVVLAPRPVIIRLGFASETKSRNRILPRSLTHCPPAFTWILSELGHMGLYLVDSAPPFVWPKVDGFPRSCSGVSPRKIAPLVGLVVVGVVAVPPLVQRVCVRVLLCLFQNLKVPLVPTAIGCMAGLVPLRHCSRGCGGAPLGSRPSRFPPSPVGSRSRWLPLSHEAAAACSLASR